jgi:hypothetical protein
MIYWDLLFDNHCVNYLCTTSEALTRNYIQEVPEL